MSLLLSLSLLTPCTYPRTALSLLLPIYNKYQMLCYCIENINCLYL